MLFDAIRTTNGRQRAGSALILVVVLTVLLSAVGILFVLMSRLDEMTSSALSTNEELDAGVAAVVSKIEQVLADDLEDVFKYYNRDFGGSSDNWDRPGDDSWLASLEPVRIESIDDTPEDPDDDDYRWPYITDLYGSIRNLGGSWIDPDQWNDDAARYRVGASGVLARVISPDERMWVIQEGADPDKTQWLPGNVRYYGARADADGDGIADSRWVPIPNLSGAKGQTFYTAIRIVGNNDKLNLNTAHSFTENVSRGAYLSEVDYES
ncbi:MAG: hypothetical protein KAS23_02600, partial [Anaerohalosphaera sp.]|nr:hypothetical protein [Anaerohalosphaera sp.]